MAIVNGIGIGVPFGIGVSTWLGIAGAVETIIRLELANNTSTTGGTVFCYDVDAVIADGQTLLTIPAGYPRMKGARWLAPGWSAVDAAGASLTNAMDVDDANTNEILQSRDLNTTWTQRGTFSAVQDLIGADGTANSGFTVSGIDIAATGDIFQNVSGLSAVRYEPSLVLKQISIAGVVSLLGNGSGTGGQWDIDLSQLSSAWEIIDRNHAAVTVVTEFIPTTSSIVQLVKLSGTGTLSVGYFNSQLELGTVSTNQKYTEAGTVSTDADVNTVATPSNVEQDADWAFKFRGTPAQTGEALKALFSFDSDATNYTEIQLNAANISANSVLLGVSNGAAVGLYTHTADVQFETNVYYVAATKTLGIRSDDVSGDISAVAFIEDTLTSHPVITALLSCGHRNEANIYQGTILNSGMPETFPNKEAAGW